jgi:hypothetical protein
MTLIKVFRFIQQVLNNPLATVQKCISGEIRVGSEMDFEKLKKLFTELGFQVT